METKVSKDPLGTVIPLNIEICSPNIEKQDVDELIDFSGKEDNLSLTEIISKELESMHFIKVLNINRLVTTRLKDLYTIDEIEIDFEYSRQVAECFFGLIKRIKDEPLSSLSEIKRKFKEIPKIGKLSKQGENYLVYDRIIGFTIINPMIYKNEESDRYPLYERVIIYYSSSE
jgi:hypothetical protein